MRVLIVYAHPEPTSFTGSMRDVAVQALRGAGHTVEVSDLYAEEFNPRAGRHDFSTVANSERFHYQSEQAHAATHQAFAPDIAREQARVTDSELLLFVFPLWWGGVPGILKGWFDRVLAYGFAYEDGMRYETGFFQGRRGLLGVVTGGTPHRFSEDGTYGSIEQVLWPTQHCLIEYMGLSTSQPFVAYAAPRVDDDQRQDYLDQWRRRVLEAATHDPAPVEDTPRPRLEVRASSQTSWSSS